MKIAIGADHGGYELKQHVLTYVRSLGYDCQDFGSFTPDAVDYPDVAEKVAQAVAAGQYERGILFCGTGVGVSIAANKIKGIRAALCHDTFTAQASRGHNDANILCMGGRVIGPGLACDIARVWFSHEERHARRVAKIGALDARR